MIEFFGTLGGRFAVGASIIAAIVAGWLGISAHYQKIGADKVIAKIEKATTINVEKANAARLSVEQLPPGSLNDRYRRD